MRPLPCFLLCLFLIGVPWSDRVVAKPAMPEMTPVDRLIRNITAYAKEKPQDAHAQYLLGRIHGLALGLNSQKIGTWRHDGVNGLPNVASDMFQERALKYQKPPGGGWNESQKIQHLSASVAAYIKAIELDPKPAHYHNGLAYVMNLGRAFADKIAPPDVRLSKREPSFAQAQAAYRNLKTAAAGSRPAWARKLNDYWREAAIDRYFEAYRRAVAADGKLQYQPTFGLTTLVSYEAGQVYKKLVAEREATAEEKTQIAEIDKHLAALKNKPHGEVTPIVFHLEHPKPLVDLLDAAKVVRFDLDGDGHVERRPWVRPDAAILCWDPAGTGRIASGKQLFGSVTFHLYPGDGYTAMNLLDDDRDGELAGSELRGLALWFDRNGNGRSDEGEVVPIEKTPVRSLSVRAISREEGAPANPTGLILRDGRVLPTYDWIAGSADE